MDIGDLLADGGVVLRSGASSKRQALHTVAEAAAQILGLSEARIMEALLEREALGSTGLGSGVAVPHARIEGLDRVTARVLLLDLLEGTVDDALGDRLLAALHDDVHELGELDVAVLGIRQDFTLRDFATTWHF